MNESLVAHRFQRLHPLRAEEDVLLDAARDVASDAPGTLLTLRRGAVSTAEAVLRFRLNWFADGILFRPFDVKLVVGDERRLYLFLSPAAGEPWERSVASAPVSQVLADVQCVADGLEELERSACPAGGLAISALYRDENGPYFLPDAYALPPLFRGLVGAPDAHRDPLSCAREVGRARVQLAETIRRYLRELKGEATREVDAFERLLERLELVVQPQDLSLDPQLERALAGSEEQGGCLVLQGSRGARHGVMEKLRRWAEDARRPSVTLRRHVGPDSEALLDIGPDDPGPLVFLDRFDQYAGFAEGLTRLADRGWLNGREILVLSRSTETLDGAAHLYLASLRHRIGVRFSEIQLPESDSDNLAPPVTSDFDTRVLETLAVARRPLSEEFLRHAFGIGAEAVAALIFRLAQARMIEVFYGRPDELTDAPQLIASPVHEFDVGEVRRGEVARLLASTLEGLGGGRGLGRSWLRLEAALLTEKDRVTALARQLADRAERSGVPLLAYAAFDRLLHAGSDSGANLEDRCRAAITMGEQHRLQGELDRAESILSEGLAVLEASTDQPTRRLAPLAAELTMHLSTLAEQRGEYQTSADLLTGVLDRYEAELPALSRGRVYLRRVWIQTKVGRLQEATEGCKLALKILDVDRHPRDVAQAYNNLGWIQFLESNYSQSLINLQRGLVLREQVGDESAVARSYNNLALTYRSLGRYEEAERSLDRSIELKTKTGDTQGVAGSQLNLGFLAFEQGHYGPARRHATEALHLARRVTDRLIEAEAHGLLGETAMEEGNLEEARYLLNLDLEICAEIDHRVERVATLRRMTSLFLRLDELEEAARTLEEAKRVMAEMPPGVEGALLERHEAEVLARSGARETALDVLSSAARSFGALRRFPLQLECLARRCQLELELGRHDRARASLEEGRDLIARHEVGRIPELFRELGEQVGTAASVHRGIATDPDLRVRALADLLGPGGDIEANRPEGALRTLMASLGVESAHWVRTPHGRSLSLRGTAVDEGEPGPALRDFIEAAGLDRARDEVVQGEDGWLAVRTRGADVGWLVLQSPRSLDDGEVAFAQAIAGILSLGTGEAAAPDREPRPSGDDETPGAAYGIIGRSAAIRDVLRMIDMVKDKDVTTLILGENGTGKDLVARAIHQGGSRSGCEFVAVNCASIPASLLESELFGHEKGAFTDAVDRHVGMFERAHGGTIFLDEIAEMPLKMQAKLLRVLQEKTFTRVGGSETIRSDARVIAATNRDLEGEVASGRFRMDLYYRLNVITIQIPPLRERTEDIEALVDYFLARFGREFRSRVRSVGREAMTCLSQYGWPGNVRELENVIKNAMVFAGREVIRMEDLPGGVVHPGAGGSGRTVEDSVRSLVETEDFTEDRPLMPRLELLVAHRLVQATGNKALAARLLGITKPTLYNRLRRYEALYGTDAAGEGETGSS